MNADLRPLQSVPPHIAALAEQIRELAGDDDLAFSDTLDGCTDAVRAARGAVRMIHANEAHAEAAKALAQRYAARAKDFEDRAARGRNALAHFMSEIAAKTLQLPEATITLSAGGQTLIGDLPVDLLPPDLVKVKREPDRTAIKAVLMSGATIEGYSLSNSPPRLQIRGGRAGGEE